MSTAVIASYVKETLARFQGNTDQVIAEQNFRIAVASLKGQIAALEAARVRVENKLAVAEEAYKLCQTRGDIKIISKDAYDEVAKTLIEKNKPFIEAMYAEGLKNTKKSNLS